MGEAAVMVAPAVRSYRGFFINPDRWQTWVPRRGDILVSTPPKCGTTWTQAMLCMLVHGGPDLPGKVPVLSPWIEAELGVSAEVVAAGLAAQTGRRVVKTHTPADGIPLWEGVTVIAVYRHPLDVFFSLRTHLANRTSMRADHPLGGETSVALRAYLERGVDLGKYEENVLSAVVRHYRETVLSGRVAGLKLFHYADMVRDGRATVRALAEAAGIAADEALIGEVAEATAFAAMRANAAEFAPVSGTGFWKSDAGFFAEAASRKWEGRVSGEEMALYEARMAELVPEVEARAWLEFGGLT